MRGVGSCLRRVGSTLLLPTAHLLHLNHLGLLRRQLLLHQELLLHESLLLSVGNQGVDTCTTNMGT